MRKDLLKALAMSCLGLLLAVQALHAQPFPSRPVRIVAPFPPGGPSDSVLADRMAVTLG